MSYNSLVGLGILFILFLISLIIFGPLITIWSLNTLFLLNIPMNLGTWFAVLWLGGFASATISGIYGKRQSG